MASRTLHLLRHVSNRPRLWVPTSFSRWCAASNQNVQGTKPDAEPKPLSRRRLLKIARRNAPPPKRRSSYEFDRSIAYSLPDGLQHVRKSSWAHFDESLDLVFRLNIDPRKAEQNIRGIAELPHGSGVATPIAVFGYPGRSMDEARKAGADLVGGEELLAETVKAKARNLSKFAACIATPDIIPLMAKQCGRILGPKGLMPNAKLGTITNDPGECVTRLKKGFCAFRTDRDGNMHLRAGKLSFSDEMLVGNCVALFGAIMAVRPETVRRKYLLQVFLSSSMGPSVEIDHRSLSKLQFKIHDELLNQSPTAP